MKVRTFLVLVLVVVFAMSAFAAEGGTGKTKAKSDSKSCCVDKAKATKVSDEHCKDMKASNASQCTMKQASAKMDCCKKEMKSVKASNDAKSTKKTEEAKDLVKLAKDTK